MFLFNHGYLYYNLSEPFFSNSVHSGAQAEVYDEIFINSSLSRAYTCTSGIKIEFGDVVVFIQNLKLQPFFNKKPNLSFDTELVCPEDDPNSDISGTNSIWIIVFFISILMVLLCCILFVIIRVQRDEGSINKKEKILSSNYR